MKEVCDEIPEQLANSGAGKGSGSDRQIGAGETEVVEMCVPVSGLAQIGTLSVIHDGLRGHYPQAAAVQCGRLCTPV